MTNPFVDVQRKYWQSNPAEKASLLARYPDDLSWAELFRLHHLNCMELVESEEGKAELSGEHFGTAKQNGAAYDLCEALVKLLVSDASPYRPRYCMVWQSQQQQPSQQGVMSNASLTHLGSLEFIRMDANNQPTEVGFAAFDDLCLVGMARPAIYRAARVFFEDGHEETVALPLLYSVSWMTGKDYDTDGSMTRFIMPVGTDNFSLGVGHQDFRIHKDGGMTLFGIGSVHQINVALEADDPRFEQKCRVRGIDPDDVRRNMK